MAKNEMNQTRRDFLKAASIAGVAATVSTILPGCATTDNTTKNPGNVPGSWDYTTDVVVLGMGFAGMASAIAAFDAGAKVIILEKEPAAYEGGNSRVCGQCIMSFKNVAGGVTYFNAMAQNHVSDYTDAFVTATVTEIINNKAWLEGILGNALTLSSIFSPELVGLPGGDQTLDYLNGGAGNSVLWKPLRAKVTSRGIQVLNQTAASMLYYDGSGNVCGVKATDLTTNKPVNVKANKAVVIATGGFEFNEPMKNNFLPAPLYGMGSPANTGDGIKMAQQLGADIIHMTNAGGPIWLGYINKDVDPTFPTCPHELNYTGNQDSMLIDSHGNRFLDESKGTVHGKGFNEFFYYECNPVTGVYEYPRIPCWLVFGSAAQAAGPIVATPAMTWTGIFHNYTWSADNTTEIGKGWILEGADIPTLAGLMNKQHAIDNPNSNIATADVTANLTATINQFNTDAGLATPLDSKFGRTNIKPLTAPYYAIRTSPGMVNTQGGTRRNEKAQIVRADGTVIPHLYAAGEMGSPFGGLYNGGGNVADCFQSGRVAGTTAFSEPAI
jgi:hypothetical protein